MPSRLAIIPAEAVGDQRLSDGDIRVLAALGTFTDKGGKCWPSCESVAEVAGCAIRSVRRSVARLAKCGYLNKVQRWGRSNVYVVKLDTPDPTVLPDKPVPLPRTVESFPPDRTVTHNGSKNVPKNAVDGIPDSVLVLAEPFLDSVKSRSARLGMIRSMLQGMTDRPVSSDVMCRALRDMVVAEADFRPVVLKAYTDRAVKLLEGEAGRRAAEGQSSVLGHPDANQGPSGWAEDEVEG